MRPLLHRSDDPSPESASRHVRHRVPTPVAARARLAPATTAAVAAAWLSPAHLMAGHGGSLGRAGFATDPSPASDAMALVLLALVALLTAGFALLALQLRRRAAHPSPVAEFLDSLDDGDRPPPPTTPETGSDSKDTGDPWSRSPDWWRSHDEKGTH